MCRYPYNPLFSPFCSVNDSFCCCFCRFQNTKKSAFSVYRHFLGFLIPIISLLVTYPHKPVGSFSGCPPLPLVDPKGLFFVRFGLFGFFGFCSKSRPKGRAFWCLELLLLCFAFCSFVRLFWLEVLLESED